MFYPAITHTHPTGLKDYSENWTCLPRWNAYKAIINT